MQVLTHAIHLTKQPTAGVEARELFTKLLVMSEQVLGPSYAIKNYNALPSFLILG
jgi:hypothetical protein